jgi:hypothetical protein
MTATVDFTAFCIDFISDALVHATDCYSSGARFEFRLIYEIFLYVEEFEEIDLSKQPTSVFRAVHAVSNRSLITFVR